MLTMDSGYEAVEEDGPVLVNKDVTARSRNVVI
jgi:hypothetical protein